MKLTKYAVVIASGVEPIPFWKYADYNPRALPTKARVLANIQGYIRYQHVLQQLSSLGVTYNFELKTNPTLVASAVTNLSFDVEYNNDNLAVELKTLIQNALNKSIFENQPQVQDNTTVITYPYNSPNNMKTETRSTIIVSEVTAGPVSPSVIVTKL